MVRLAKEHDAPLFSSSSLRYAESVAQFPERREQTGAILGSMMLLTIVVNPLLVYLSPRGRRLPAFIALVLLGGVLLTCVPFVTGPAPTLPTRT